MATNWQIAQAFALNTGKEGAKKAYSVYRDPSDQGDIVYSWGSHFPMAVRNDKDKIFLVNGDRFSRSTSRHQTYVRSAIRDYRNPKYRDYTSLTVPFSTLRQIYGLYNWYNLHVKVIDVGQDKVIIKCLTCDLYFDDYWTLEQHKLENQSEYHNTYYFHQLAGSTFSAEYNGETKYFLSGFDETHSRNTDGYFLSVLPHKPKNIEHAFEMLKPKVVKDAEKKGLSILRQGDIFAIPTNLDTRTLKRKGDHYRSELIEHGYWGRNYTSIEYPRLLQTSHVATEVVVYKNVQYARGVLRHRPTEFGRRAPEHINISLGKVWHRIARNTALASYSLGGRVD